jgi:hypothetical protein
MDIVDRFCSDELELLRSAINGDCTVCTPTLSTACRNEVRAIYGWFGILMAGSQLGALFNPALRSGMVCGRLVSWIAYKKIYK